MQERENVCVCEKEREREKEKGRERVGGERDPLIFKGIRIVDLTDKKFFPQL